MKYKRRIMVLNLVCFICMLSIPGYATQKAVSGKDGLDKEEKELIQAGLKPFKPKLLWEKRFKKQLRGVDVAKGSGDVIVTSNHQICLFNQSGKLLWKQGVIERIHKPLHARISDDGERITYDMIDWDTYFTVVFYVDRNNKEKWHKAFPGASYISPDGSWVVVAPAGETGRAIFILNEKGGVVLKKEYDWAGHAFLRFSEDSKYVAVMDGAFEGTETIFWIFDRNGNIVLEFKRKHGYRVSSFASNGLFSVAGMMLESIRNLKGDKIITGHNVIISGDGKIAIKRTESKTATTVELIEMPSLKINKVYKLSASDFYRAGLNISSKGRYLVLSSDETSSEHVIILNTLNDTFWKFKPVLQSESGKANQELSQSLEWVFDLFITKDEKYMVVFTIDEQSKHIMRYYQLR